MALALFLLGLIVAGCGGVSPTVFYNPEFSFNYIERVAVIPFENLSNDQGAGARATRFCVTDLLARRAFDVVEPGEVAKVLEKYSVVRTAELTKDQIVAIGTELKVQGLLLGTVGESETIRSGSANSNTVTLVLRMVETEQGVTVWSSTVTEGGRGFWASVLGSGEKSKSEVTRKAVRRAIGTLVK